MSMFDITEDRKLQRIIYEDAMLPLKSIWDVKILNAFPSTFEDALIVQKYDIGTVHQPAATRTIEWLDSNGKCLDHIYPDASTIEGAGHGAFAKRNLPKGTVVTGSPLHHIPFKEKFVPMFQIYEDQKVSSVEERQAIAQQLVINYCFGHSESSVLLCPCK